MGKFHRYVATLICMAILITGPAFATDSISVYEATLVNARTALQAERFPEALNALHAAAGQLEAVAADSSGGIRDKLDSVAREIEGLRRELEAGSVVNAARIDQLVRTGAQAMRDATVANAPLQQSTSLKTLFRDLGGDFKHLPSKDSLVVASIGGAAALASHPFDSGFNQKLQGDNGFFKPGDVLGSAGVLMGASAGTYLLGRASGHGRVAHVGLDLLRAQIVTEAMVEPLKLIVRRERPNNSGGYSFPSGHAAMTFATVTVIERHYGWKWAVPLYGWASYIAASRLHDNVHYLSDVAFGAAVGTIAGRTVSRHGKSNFALIPYSTPGGGRAMALVYSWK